MWNRKKDETLAVSGMSVKQKRVKASDPTLLKDNIVNETLG